ncbi:MAG: DUF1573 domain-containing protein [Fimbriimonadales bacterium]
MSPVLALSLLLVVAGGDIGPTLPPRTSTHIHRVNVEVQRLLSQSKFAEAGTKLGEWPLSEIGYQVSDAYADVIKEAASVWSLATDGRTRFVPSSEPFVRFIFAEMPADGDLFTWRDGRLAATVPIFAEDLKPASRRSMAWNAAKAFGYALGLAPTTRRRHLMGPVVYRPDNPQDPKLVPDIAEISHLSHLLQAREALSRAIASRSKLTPAQPLIALDKKTLDGGTVTQGTKVEFSLTISNKGNAPALLDLESTCACMIALARPGIAPGESIDVKIVLDTADYMGALDKHLYVHTNDPAEPTRTLEMHVVSVPEYRVLPEGIQVVSLSEDAPTTHDIIVYATPGNPIRVLTAQAGKPNVETQVLPFNEPIVDPLFGPTPQKRLGYRVRVRFPTDYRAGLEWVRIIILTDSKKRPNADVTIETHKGIFAQPKTAYFGVVATGQSVTRTVIVEHATKPFNIDGVSAEGDTIEATWSADSDRKYRITITGKPAKPGPISGMVTVNTDSDRYPTITIPVIGTVK